MLDAPILKSALALEENKAVLAAHFNAKPVRSPVTEESEISDQVPHPLRIEGRCGSRRRGRQRNEPRTGLQKCRATLLEMVRNATI